MKNCFVIYLTKILWAKTRTRHYNSFILSFQLSCVHIVGAQGPVENALLIEIFALTNPIAGLAEFFDGNTVLATAAESFNNYAYAAAEALSESHFQCIELVLEKFQKQNNIFQWRHVSCLNCLTRVCFETTKIWMFYHIFSNWGSICASFWYFEILFQSTNVY